MEHEGTLKNSEADLRAIMESLPGVVFAVDREGRICFINRVLPGFTMEQTLGISVYAFVPPESQPIIAQAIEETLRTGNPTHYEIRGPGAHGAPAWYLTNVGAVRRG